MRILLLISLMIIISCSNPKKLTHPSHLLDGSWIPVQEELAGRTLSKTEFEKQKLIIRDSNYIFTAESVDKGIARYNNGKMDIYGKEGVNTGKHFTAIYKLENEQLIICYNLKGDSYPEAYETKGKLYLLCVFKKE